MIAKRPALPAAASLLISAVTFVAPARADLKLCNFTPSRVGISIGHRDTDNLISRNEILHSREVGVLFRPESGRDFAGHRNRLLANRIVDTGGDNSIAVDIQGATEGIELRENRIEETRGAAGRTAIRLGAETTDIQLQNNRITGFAVEVQQVK